MRFACWINKAKNKRSEYIILTAFPLQQWLHQSASMLRYTHKAPLLFNYNWNKSGKKSSVPNSKNYLEILLDGLRRTTKKLSQNSGLGPRFRSRNIPDTKGECR
jgi:hypothetical protein